MVYMLQEERKKVRYLEEKLEALEKRYYEREDRWLNIIEARKD